MRVDFVRLSGSAERDGAVFAELDQVIHELRLLQVLGSSGRPLDQRLHWKLETPQETRLTICKYYSREMLTFDIHRDIFSERSINCAHRLASLYSNANILFA